MSVIYDETKFKRYILSYYVLSSYVEKNIDRFCKEVINKDLSNKQFATFLAYSDNRGIGMFAQSHHQKIRKFDFSCITEPEFDELFSLRDEEKEAQLESLINLYLETIEYDNEFLRMICDKENIVLNRFTSVVQPEKEIIIVEDNFICYFNLVPLLNDTIINSNCINRYTKKEFSKKTIDDLKFKFKKEYEMCYHFLKKA